ncbi:uncharacterized protein CEXT_801521 [Caerostris extrusa]|uniref:Uncharacterized protein n=1 Tax=Caerostris extrusa TaxID=172846 RepID=A0AAV4P4Y6_CAEEX|nr:uncharacterized protein CEXT_801521 [Caerostris extrusa]
MLRQLKGKAKALRAAFCDNDETGDEIENCFGQLKKMEVPEEIEIIAEKCCPSVGDRKTGPEVRDWYCNNTAEAIQQVYTYTTEYITVIQILTECSVAPKRHSVRQ